MTVLLSSHILSEVEQIADHIGIISNGRLLYQEEIKENTDLGKYIFNVMKKAGNKNV